LAGFFHFNNINPIEGLGSQIFPLNVWLNPAYWPFAILDRAAATDVSAVVALGVFAIACYAMARCFDVPMLPSVVAAQLCIVLFAPIANLILWPIMLTSTAPNRMPATAAHRRPGENDGCSGLAML
jgi:hypothetical protein